MVKLEIQNLAFSYTSKTPIFDNLNLTFENQTTAIIGQNGAGKTTLVKLLKGLLRPVRGKILYNGQDIRQETVASLAKEIGLIFQNPNDQIFNNTVLDEVMFGPRNIGFEASDAEKLALTALKRVQLAGELETNPYDLSLSERKLIAIASILAMDPQVIIFDEPTMGQDYQGKKLLKEIIQEEKEKGKLILCILHDMDFAAETFEHTIVLNRGKVLLEGTSRQVFAEKEILENAFLEQPQSTQIARALGLSGTFLNHQELIHEMKNQEQ